MEAADGAPPESFGAHCSPDFRPHLCPDLAPEHQALERLEAEITELWGHINAATYRFLKLIAEFDQRQGWALHGLANCAQWLNWQCGIGAVAAREKVRVARALDGLPKIAESFRRGVISYSKVRAMTRIAAPENEAELLNIAESGTAAHVERLVAKYRRVERLEDAERANGLHRHRSVRFFHDEDGSLVIHAKLPPEIGAVVQKAIEAALAIVEKTETESNVSAETSGAGETGKAGETSEAAYERMLAQDAPRQDTLAAKRADALRFLADSFLTRESDDCGNIADRFQVIVHVDQRLLASGSAPDPARCELEDERALALETVRRLGCDASLVGMIDGDDGEPLNVGRRTRSIPPSLARALKARDGGCRFPGCGRTRFTEGHHVEHWADGGETKLGNLVTLCRFHHRLIHEGGFGLHVLDDGAQRNSFVFTRPDGTRLEPNGRQCFRGNNFTPAHRNGGDLTLFALNRAAGLDIDWQTGRCLWLGERIDYGLGVEALIQRRDLARMAHESTPAAP
jgi:hypothetical protein